MSEVLLYQEKAPIKQGCMRKRARETARERERERDREGWERGRESEGERERQSEKEVGWWSFALLIQTCTSMC